jgi:hypothetical protein
MGTDTDVTITVIEYDHDLQATGETSQATLSIHEIGRIIDRARRAEMACRMMNDNPVVNGYLDDLQTELEAAGIATAVAGDFSR